MCGEVSAVQFDRAEIEPNAISPALSFISRHRAVEAHQAHNLKTVGSSPTGATMRTTLLTEFQVRNINQG